VRPVTSEPQKYRWPLVLLFVLPFIRVVVYNGVINLLDAQGWDLFWWGLRPVPWDTFINTVLLAITYPWARGHAAPFVLLVWRFMLAYTVVSVLWFGVAYAGWLPYFYGAAPLLVVTLWFARTASRISLAHAYFLALIAFGIRIPRLVDFGGPLVQGLTYTILAWMIALLAVWLLANYGGWSKRAQVGIILGIAIAELYHYWSALPLVLGNLLFLLDLLATNRVLELPLIYVVRDGGWLYRVWHRCLGRRGPPSV